MAVSFWGAHNYRSARVAGGSNGKERGRRQAASSEEYTGQQKGSEDLDQNKKGELQEAERTQMPINGSESDG
eukprot:5368681-Pyramimonas_sp.AAC.1